MALTWDNIFAIQSDGAAVIHNIEIVEGLPFNTKAMVDFICWMWLEETMCHQAVISLITHHFSYVECGCRYGKL